MSETQKFLDVEGVKVLWDQVNLKDYPNNETLVAVLNAIDETKADKSYVDEQIENEHTWESLPDKPFGEVDGLIEQKNYQTTVTGKEYVIVHDNVEYDVVVKHVGSFTTNGEYYYVGNPNLISSNFEADAEYPFCYYTYSKITGPTMPSINYFNYKITEDNPTPVQGSYIVYTRGIVTKTIDTKYLPDEVVMESEIVEPTWEALPDKPFYYNENIILKCNKTFNNAEFITTNYFENQGYYKFTYDNTEEYIIYVDGVHSVGDSNYSQYPFYITFGYYTIMHFQEGNSHRLKIEEIQSDLKQIEEKFIPDTIARVEDIPEEVVYFDFDFYDGNLIGSAYNKLKTLLDDGKTVFIRYNDNGELGVTGAVYYSSEDGNISAEAIEYDGIKYFEFPNTEGDLTATTFISSFSEHEKSMLKMSNWDESKTGDVERYPSINAMEEYVTSIIPTEDDAIEVLAEMEIIDPATNSDGTVLTDENGKIILL